mmetsp:Transcript_7332/g.13578  ORF Transcript_7332/g.13578 Transcript_7332/m.13578 type:complete len:205 (-) Transcript_7332:27-641(-)
MARKLMSRHNSVLSFWYGEHEPLERVTFANAPLWYKKDPELDARIKADFEEDINKALHNEYDSWVEESQAHAIALIVLLDQFSRNIYRDTPQMFAYDFKALDVARKVIEKGWDRTLPLPMRFNTYLPLMHSERLSDQQWLTELVEAAEAEASEEVKPKLIQFKGFGIKHKVIIERFGRFPHRNSILGRVSTAEEEEFLKTNSGF